MFRPSPFSAETVESRVRSAKFLRFAIQDLSPRSCTYPDGGEPRYPLPGLASSVALEPAATIRRRLSFTPIQSYRRMSMCFSHDLDFGHVVAALIVGMGLIPLATMGLWD